MKTKIRTTLLTALFSFIMLAGALAQDKYEYAVIDFTPWTKTMEISINGIDYKKIDVAKSEVKGNSDVNAALKEVNEMVKEGWELFNTNTMGGGAVITKSFIFFLRRKVK